jgi:hypothetical protein
MNDAESRTLLSIMMFGGDIEQLHADMKNTFIYSILDDRIDATFKGDICPLAKAFASQLAGSRPGTAVLFAAVLCELAEGGKRRVEIGDMVDAFPFHVPSEAVLEAAWDAQKYGEGPEAPDGRPYDNALDAAWAWRNSP